MEIGDRVLVTANCESNSSYEPVIEDKEKYVGHTATVESIDSGSSRCRIVLQFDDRELDDTYHDEGKWYFGFCELIVLEEENRFYRK